MWKCLSNSMMSNDNLLSVLTRLSDSYCDSVWTKGLHTNNCFFNWLFPWEKHFCFPSVELSGKKNTSWQICQIISGLSRHESVALHTVRRWYYSPGDPKPMDVIRCPLTSMWCNPGDLKTRVPSYALTCWKRTWSLTVAELGQQKNLHWLTWLFLSNLAVSAMCFLDVWSRWLHFYQVSSS